MNKPETLIINVPVSQDVQILSPLVKGDKAVISMDVLTAMVGFLPEVPLKNKMAALKDAIDAVYTPEQFITLLRSEVVLHDTIEAIKEYSNLKNNP